MKYLNIIILLFVTAIVIFWRKTAETYEEVKPAKDSSKYVAITKLITTAFTTTVSSMLNVKKDIVLKSSGKIHMKMK